MASFQNILCKCYLNFPNFRRYFQVQFSYRKSNKRGQIVICSGLQMSFKHKTLKKKILEIQPVVTGLSKMRSFIAVRRALKDYRQRKEQQLILSFLSINRLKSLFFQRSIKVKQPKKKSFVFIRNVCASRHGVRTIFFTPVQPQH